MFLKIYLSKNSVISFIKENKITIRKWSQYSYGGYFLLEEINIRKEWFICIIENQH